MAAPRKKWLTVDEGVDAILAMTNQAAKDLAEHIVAKPGAPAKRSPSKPANPMEVARGMARAAAQELTLNSADDWMGLYKGGLEQGWNALAGTGLVEGAG